MNPEEISRRAAEKRKEKKESEQRSSPNKKTISGRTYEAMSFAAYRKIFPRNFNFALWALLCVPGITLCIIWFSEDDPWIGWLYGGIACIGVFFARWMMNFFAQLSTYGEYKNFQSELGFKLFNWGKLGSIPGQLSNRHWSSECSIEIKTMPTLNEAQLKNIEKALKRFNEKANAHFYETSMSSRGMKEWKLNGKLKVTGSADAAVYGEMYLLFSKDLRTIQKQYPVIESALVLFDNDVYKVEPPPNTDTMS